MGPRSEVGLRPIGAYSPTCKLYEVEAAPAGGQGSDIRSQKSEIRGPAFAKAPARQADVRGQTSAATIAALRWLILIG